jgi:hypothetical protein
MTTETDRQELHHLVDRLTAEDTADALDYVRWLAAQEDALTAEEIALVHAGEKQIADGEYERLEDLRTRVGR